MVRPKDCTNDARRPMKMPRGIDTCASVAEYRSSLPEGKFIACQSCWSGKAVVLMKRGNIELAKDDRAA